MANSTVQRLGSDIAMGDALVLGPKGRRASYRVRAIRDPKGRTTEFTLLYIDGSGPFPGERTQRMRLYIDKPYDVLVESAAPRARRLIEHVVGGGTVASALSEGVASSHYWDAGYESASHHDSSGFPKPRRVSDLDDLLTFAMENDKRAQGLTHDRADRRTLEFFAGATAYHRLAAPSRSAKPFDHLSPA